MNCKTCDGTGQIAVRKPGYDGEPDIGFLNCPECKPAGSIDVVEFIDALGGYSAIDALGKIDLIRGAIAWGGAAYAEEQLKERKEQLERMQDTFEIKVQAN